MAKADRRCPPLPTLQYIRNAPAEVATPVRTRVETVFPQTTAAATSDR